jgi:UDP-GlcNAc:undecaprenyl-phosphate/decaprenyl-phosphate GlcNAc-1-phosphate transferase
VIAHLAVGATAAVITAAAVPLVARLARRLGATVTPQDTPDRGRGPVPSMGGLAMLLGFLAAMGVAWVLPGFEPLFSSTSEPLALVLGAVVIVIIGVADDILTLPPTVKLAGQIIAALGVVILGIQLVYFWIPGVEVIALSSDLGFPLTILALVAMINAMNLIDGLDGLAAGIAAIGALAFFAFTVRSQTSGLVEGVPNAATLVAAIVAGMALGFLVHNWYPARIIMGDTGSMLLGLLLGAAGVTYVGRTAAPSSADFYGSIPLLVPVLVLAIPFLDSAFAVIRRVIARRPITSGDRGHLHHVLLAFGHSHRRAVLVLYYWSALLALGSVGPAFLPITRLLPWLLAAGVLGVAVTALGVRAPRELAARDPAAREPVAMDPAAMDPVAMDPVAMDPGAMGPGADAVVTPFDGRVDRRAGSA